MIAVASTLDFEAAGLLPPLLLPLEHAVVTVRAPTTMTAAASCRDLRTFMFFLPVECQIGGGLPGAGMPIPPESVGLCARLTDDR
ncbi:hypothetical protein GCM10009664_65510 [Kitasatospora gansuensis]